MSARLLKVILQAVFITEDADGDLSEITTQPLQFTAAQWRQLDPTAWAEQGAQAVAAQLASVGEQQPDMPAADPPPPTHRKRGPDTKRR